MRATWRSSLATNPTAVTQHPRVSFRSNGICDFGPALAVFVPSIAYLLQGACFLPDVQAASAWPVLFELLH